MMRTPTGRFEKVDRETWGARVRFGYGLEIFCDEVEITTRRGKVFSAQVKTI